MKFSFPIIVPAVLASADALSASEIGFLKDQLWDFTMAGLRWKWPIERYRNAKDDDGRRQSRKTLPSYAPIDEHLLSRSLQDLDLDLLDGELAISLHAYMLIHGVDKRSSAERDLFSQLAMIDWRMLLHLPKEETMHNGKISAEDSCSKIEYPVFGMLAMLHDELALNPPASNYPGIDMTETFVDTHIDDTNFRNHLF